MPFTELQQKEISEVLSSFSLNANEKNVYLALLSMGSTTVTPLARSVRLPVTTVQSILQRLATEGIIIVSKHKSRHLYEAPNPDVLRKILERRLEEVKNVIPLLATLSKSDSYKSNIKVYSHERMADIFHDVLNCKSKIMYEIMSPKDFQDILGEKFHLTPRRIKRGIYLKTLRVEKYEIKRYTEADHTDKLREVKFLPREMTFKASIVFWDDTVAIFSSFHEGLACVITSVSFREMIQQLFELLWSISRPYVAKDSYPDVEK